MNRILSLDILRSFAIIGMVICHYVTFIYPDDTAWGYFIADEIIGDWCAPLFLVLVGMSWQVSYQKAISYKYTDTAIRNKTLKKALYLFILALLFQLVIYGIKEVFSWDILSTIAASFVLLYFTRQWHNKTLIWMILAIILVSSPAIRISTGNNLDDKSNVWLNDMYRCRNTLSF